MDMVPNADFRRESYIGIINKRQETRDDLEEKGMTDVIYAKNQASSLIV